MHSEQRYTGTLAGCDGSMTATLTRMNDQFAFAPSDGALVIRGKVAPDGTFAGDLDTQPPGKTPYMLRVAGHAGAESATLTYTTPRCTARGQLTLRPATLMP